MANVGSALEKVINTSAKAVGELQNGMNKILWGSANPQSAQTAKYDSATQSVTYTTVRTNPTPPQKKTLINSGLFNALDALNAVDLCNVLTYVLSNINIKKKPRPEQPWTATQTAFYTFQDKAFIVQTAIDKYLAFPNVLVGSFAGSSIQPQTQEQVISGSGVAPGQSSVVGSAVAAYNVFNLIQVIQDTFSTPNQSSTGSLFTPEEKEIIKLVPGLVGNANFIKDFLGSTSKYLDYRQIDSKDLIKLQKKINDLRGICVAVNTLDFKNALAVAGNILNVDIRSQVQELSRFINPTEIAKTIAQINNAIRSFIQIARKLQGILQTSQFIIKIAILLIKIFKFVKTFLLALPLPNLFTTSGIQTAFSSAKEAATNLSNGLVKLLKQINSLLSVVLIFVRYTLANANELEIRLRTLIATLEACDAMKDSDVLKELKVSTESLAELKAQLENYIIQYDSKTNPDTAFFGQYNIRVVEEEIVDRTVTNKRRRGIALDQNGTIVAQSDLTFATNPTIIIEEVKLKLIAAGLVQPSLGALDGADLAVIGESLDYLESNDVLQDNLNIETFESVDSPENDDETKGLGLNAFINNLPGGKRLRKRVRKSLDEASARLGAQIRSEGVTSSNITTSARSLTQGV